MLLVYNYNCLKPKNIWKIISRSNQIKIEIYNLHACLHACFTCMFTCMFLHACLHACFYMHVYMHVLHACK
jgi:hypothetical protein